MHLLIDALSVNNLSGRHVLAGHVRQLVAGLPDRWRFTVMVGRANARIAGDFPEQVQLHRAPLGSSWFGRALWLSRHARRLSRTLAVDMVFSPSGMLSGGFDCPQVVLAQNPWPLMPGMAKGADSLKAMLQRREFGRAQRHAKLMVFNSGYMRDLYSDRFGPRPAGTIVAYQGIGESLFTNDAWAAESARRKPMVLCVSVMARHKAIEVLVEAFRIAGNPAAELLLVGAWPDPEYRRQIESLVERRGLTTRVKLLGHVETAKLHELYGQARVFCLLSRCESFGIPALEAQAFGTPAVVAEGTAAPEIVGAGGIAVPAGNALAAAKCLQELLEDDAAWQEKSAAARLNSQRFRWPECSAPLVEAVDRLGHDGG